MKLLEAAKKFSGARGEDVEQWFDKFLLTADITIEKAEDKSAAKLARILPIFLEGAAYATWKQIHPAKRDDLNAVKSELFRVFGRSKLQAWQDLNDVQFIPGDSVDILADQIKGSLRIMVGDAAAIPDELVSFYLIDALPSQISSQIKVRHGETMELSPIISCAKSLLANPSELNSTAAMAVKPVDRRPRGLSQLRCDGCRRRGHTLEQCTTTCFRCGEVGHLRPSCPKLANSGNGRAVAAAPDHAAPAITH